MMRDLPRQFGAAGLVLLSSLMVSLLISEPCFSRNSTAACQSPSSRPAAQQSVLSRLGLSGSVSGPMDEPLEGAEVSLVPSDGITHFFHQQLSPDMVTARTVTGSDGLFHLEFSEDESSRIGRHDLILVVRSEGHAIHVSSIKPNRLLSDAPLEPVRLDKSAATTLNLLDAGGQPVSHAEIRVAIVGDQRIPWTVAKRWPVTTTGSQGEAELHGAKAGAVQGVFVTHPEFGQLRVPAAFDGSGNIAARLPQIYSVQADLQRHPSIAAGQLKNARFRIVCNGIDSSRGSIPSAAWADVQVDDDGNLILPRLPAGRLMIALLEPEPEDWGLTIDFNNLLQVGPSSEEQTVQVHINPQAQWQVQVVDRESGEPVPGILVEVYIEGLKKHVSNSRGAASGRVWHAGTEWFVSDSRGEWFSTNTSMTSINGPAEDGVFNLKPFGMTRASAARGMVIDAGGLPVSGATVEFTSSGERQNQIGTVWSNRDGSFRLPGVRDGTVVVLRARNGFELSGQINCEWNVSQPVTLELKPYPTTRPAGRIVDGSGRPVAGLPIRLVRGDVVTVEGYEREELRARPLYEDDPEIFTGANGEFEGPPTLEIGQRIAVQIGDPRCFEFQSPYLQLAEPLAGSDSTDLGQFRVALHPAITSYEVTVQDSAGSPVAGAQVILLGALSGKSRGESNAAGILDVRMPGGVSLIAVRARGHHVFFGKVEADQQKIPVQLVPNTMPVPARKSFRSLAASDFESAARKLFLKIEKPVAGQSSYIRQFLYLMALARINPMEVTRQAVESLDPVAKDAAQSALFSMEITDPGTLESAEFRKLSARQRVSLLISSAIATNDTRLRDEWLGEALVVARSQSGYEFRSLMAFLAGTLARMGETGLAQDVVAEMWSTCDDLQRQLESGESKTSLGESRTVAIALALTDLKKSLRLIELTADNDEAGWLKTQALMGAAQIDLPKAMNVLKEDLGGKLPGPNVGMWVRDFDFSSSNFHVAPELADALGPYIEDPMGQIGFYLLNARLSEGESQLRHVRQASAAISRYQVRALDDFYHFHAVKFIFEGTKYIQSLPAEELNILVFESLGSLPPDFSTGRWKSVLAGAARILALVDTELARGLLEPCMQDTGWWAVGRQAGFSRHPTFQSVAWIDPEWAVEFCEEAVAGELRHSPFDQMELRVAIVTELMKAAGTLRNQGTDR